MSTSFCEFKKVDIQLHPETDFHNYHNKNISTNVSWLMLLVISAPVTLTHQLQTSYNVGGRVPVGIPEDILIVAHGGKTGMPAVLFGSKHCTLHVSDMFSAIALAMFAHCALSTNKLDMFPKTINMTGIAAP